MVIAASLWMTLQWWLAANSLFQQIPNFSASCWPSGTVPVEITWPSTLPNVPPMRIAAAGRPNFIPLCVDEDWGAACTVSTMALLGVIIQCNLKWDKQVEAMVAKANTRRYFITALISGLVYNSGTLSGAILHLHSAFTGISCPCVAPRSDQSASRASRTGTKTMSSHSSSWDLLCASTKDYRVSNVAGASLYTLPEPLLVDFSAVKSLAAGYHPEEAAAIRKPCATTANWIRSPQKKRKQIR